MPSVADILAEAGVELPPDVVAKLKSAATENRTTEEPGGGYLSTVLAELSHPNNEAAQVLETDVDYSSLPPESRAPAKFTGWKERFLVALRHCGVILIACKEARISRQTAREQRGLDPEFAAAWDSAIEDAVDRVEARATQIAAEGLLRPIYQGGKLMGYEREFDAGMQQFLLKHKRKDVFGDKLDVSLSGGLAHVHIDAESVASIVSTNSPLLAKRLASAGQKQLPDSQPE